MTALLFPGQGSHAAGMDEPWRDGEVIPRGIELLGYDPFARLDEGTRFQQPALFLCGLAALEAEPGLHEPAAGAGHSLGEYTALTAAGALDFEDALRLVALRGDAMARAGEAAPGGMLALLGAGNGDADELTRRHRLTIANDNAPGQLVLSGAADAIEAAEAEVRERRLRARKLDVSGAFHSELMVPAAEELACALAQITIRPPRFPVYSNGTASPFGNVRAELAANLLRTVRWRETLLALRARGVERFVTLGPDKVLNGLVKRTLAVAA
ncbi:MAG: ACP S-malonyltransferase [Thermoleophilaceae bacterium]